MDALHSELNLLASKKTLQPAEQIISNKIVDFEKIVHKAAEEKPLHDLEDDLMKLVQVNNGVLSMQICGRLAECFIHIYKISKKLDGSNLIALASKKPCVSCFYTVGFVLKVQGEKLMSQIPKLAEKILNTQRKYLNSALFALSVCFKVAGPEMQKLALRGFDFSTFNFLPDQQTTQLYSIKLAKQIAKLKSLPYQAMLPQAIAQMETTKFKFVKDKIGDYISYILIAKAKDRPTLQQCFEEMRRCQDVFTILHRFIMHIDNTFMQDNADIFLQFLIDKDKQFVKTFASLLSIQTKKKLFESLSKERCEYNLLNVLWALSYDEDSDRQCSALAQEIITTKPSERDKTVSFYKEMTEKNHDLAEEVLHSCCTFLAYPPPQHKKLGRHLVGMALIATTIMQADKQQFRKEREKLTIFQKRAFTTQNIMKGQFIAAFFVAKAGLLVSNEVIHDAIDRTIDYFSAKAGQQPVKEHLLLSAISSFFLTYQMEGPTLQEFLQIFSFYPNLTAMGRLFSILTPELETVDVFNFMNKFAIRHETSERFLRTRLRNPFSSETIVLWPKKIEISYDAIEVYITVDDINQLIFDNYAKFILQAPEECKLTLNFLFEGQKPLVHFIFLISNDKEAKKLLPGSTIQSMLDFIAAADDANIVEIEYAGEVIGNMCEDAETLDAIFKYTSHLNDMKRSLIYKSIFPVCAIATEKQINEAIQDLNAICGKQNDYYAYAMFALSCIFQSCTMQIISLRLASLECYFLLQFLNMPIILAPLNFYHTALCFNAILPLLSAENDQSIDPIIINILQSFGTTNIAYHNGIYNRVIIQSLLFVRNLISNPRLHFSSKRTGRATVNSSCSAFAEFMKSNRKSDFFEYVGETLWSLQVDKTSAGLEFLEQSCAISTKITEWISIYKQIVIDGVLPGTNIQANKTLKYSALFILRYTLRLLNEMEQLPKHELDEVLDILTTSMNTEKSSKVLYQTSHRLSELIEVFKTKRNPHDDENYIISSLPKIKATIPSCLTHISSTLTFLRSYTRFLFSNNLMTADELKVFVTSLKNSNKTPSSINLFCELLNHVIHTHDVELCNIIIEGAVYYNPAIFRVVERALTLFSNSDSNWKDVSQMRTLYSLTLHHIYTSFIWSEVKLSDIKLTCHELLDFFTKDITRTTEQWRINSAVIGICATIGSFEEIDFDLNAILDVVPKNIASSATFSKAFYSRLSRMQDNKELISHFMEYLNAVELPENASDSNKHTLEEVREKAQKLANGEEVPRETIYADLELTIPNIPIELKRRLSYQLSIPNITIIPAVEKNPPSSILQPPPEDNNNQEENNEPVPENEFGHKVEEHEEEEEKHEILNEEEEKHEDDNEEHHEEEKKEEEEKHEEQPEEEKHEEQPEEEKHEDQPEEEKHEEQPEEEKHEEQPEEEKHEEQPEEEKHEEQPEEEKHEEQPEEEKHEEQPEEEKHEEQPEEEKHEEQKSSSDNDENENDEEKKESDDENEKNEGSNDDNKEQPEEGNESSGEAI